MVFIKSVLQAIPTYVMSCFLLPKTLCDAIESIFNQYWWGLNQSEGYTSVLGGNFVSLRRG